MANAYSTRPAPTRPARRPPIRKPLTVAMELLGIRQRLAPMMAIAYVTSAALKAEEADIDAEAALVLQRSVGDELDRQLERLDAIATRCQELKP